MNDSNNNKKDPLHGKTLQYIVEYLHQALGWEVLAEKINIKCFQSNPSVKSSLTFLRKTPWARAKVESLYLWLLRQESKEIELNVE
ncbi:MAG: VF530 family DNA-binding protein [Patescibacteria group bacterium]